MIPQGSKPVTKRLTNQTRAKRVSNQRDRLKHHEKLLKKRQAYRAAHRKEINASHLKWEHAHPEKMALYRKKKNARRRQLRREARRRAQRNTR